MWQILLGVHLGGWAVFVGSTLLVYNVLEARYSGFKIFIVN